MYSERLDGKKAADAARLACAAQVGAMLKEQREFKLIKQYELAQLTKIDQGTISMFEHGHTDLSIGRVKALLNAVGLDLVVSELAD